MCVRTLLDGHSGYSGGRTFGSSTRTHARQFATDYTSDFGWGFMLKKEFRDQYARTREGIADILQCQIVASVGAYDPT